MPSNVENVQTKLQRIADKARNDRKCQFTSLFHLMNIELLWACFEQLKGSAAPGIDGLTKQQYEMDLLENLADLVKRLHQMSYRPQPVKRVYIEKPGSDKKRPLGIPVLEDKLVQAGLVKILQAIYGQDFIEDSYGFRPGLGCHDALRALSRTVEDRPTDYIVEADIRGFFDNVDQEQLMRFLGHRIADKRILRYIKRCLKAGIQEDGHYRASEKGTPQGGVISPLLANLYLHYTLDLWFTKRFMKTCEGYARLIRYADDFVVCFQRETDAQRFRQEMENRLNQYGLEIAPGKTKCIAFGKGSQKRAKERGEKLGTFDFLGFTHYCSYSWKGTRFRMKRKTISKRLTAKLKAYKTWLKKNTTLTTEEIMKKTAMKLRGHYGYYGVTDNTKGLEAYYREVKKILYKWLNRRSNRVSYNRAKFMLLLERFPLPTPRIKVSLF